MINLGYFLVAWWFLTRSLIGVLVFFWMGSSTLLVVRSYACGVWFRRDNFVECDDDEVLVVFLTLGGRHPDGPPSKMHDTLVILTLLVDYICPRW